MSAERIAAVAQTIEQKRRRQVVCMAIGALVVSVASGAQASSQDAPVAAKQRPQVTVAMPGALRNEQARVVVTGCPTEDSCRIDFRLSNDGEPIWVVRRQVP